MADSFNYKITTESEMFSFDFTQMLGPTETITVASSSIIVIDGVDAAASSMLSGGAVITGDLASQRLVGGLTGVTYRLVMTITTSLSNIYVAVGDVTVLDTTQV